MKVIVLLISCLVVLGIASSSSAQKRFITFSGLKWEVKTSPRPVGPGPNVFSDSTKNVWVDKQGRLHLKITQQQGRYTCAEVVCQKSFGYGHYRFEVATVKNLAPSVVGGLFTWDNTDPADAHREIDFEYGYWLNTKQPNFQNVIQPYAHNGNMNRFSVRHQTKLVHEFNWQPTKIDFRTFSPVARSKRPIATWTYTGSDIHRPGREQTRINLWLFNGMIPASTGDPEMIISRFTFKH